MLRFTALFILAMTNNTQEVTMMNNIKALEYLKTQALYTHQIPYNENWYIEI